MLLPAQDTLFQDVPLDVLLAISRGIYRFLCREENADLQQQAAEMGLIGDYQLAFGNALFLRMQPVAWLRESNRPVHVSYTPDRIQHNLWDCVCIMAVWMYATGNATVKLNLALLPNIDQYARLYKVYLMHLAGV